MCLKEQLSLKPCQQLLPLQHSVLGVSRHLRIKKHVPQCETKAFTLNTVWHPCYLWCVRTMFWIPLWYNRCCQYPDVDSRDLFTFYHPNQYLIASNVVFTTFDVWCHTNPGPARFDLSGLKVSLKQWSSTNKISSLVNLHFAVITWFNYLIQIHDACWNMVLSNIVF